MRRVVDGWAIVQEGDIATLTQDEVGIHRMFFIFTDKRWCKENQEWRRKQIWDKFKMKLVPGEKVVPVKIVIGGK